MYTELIRHTVCTAIGAVIGVTIGSVVAEKIGWEKPVILSKKDKKALEDISVEELAGVGQA